jgi:hypothetical protein
MRTEHVLHGFMDYYPSLLLQMLLCVALCVHTKPFQKLPLLPLLLLAALMYHMVELCVTNHAASSLFNNPLSFIRSTGPAHSPPAARKGILVAALNGSRLWSMGPSTSALPPARRGSTCAAQQQQQQQQQQRR